MLQNDIVSQNVWICPKCFTNNIHTTLTCDCGLSIKQDDLEVYGSTITAEKLFKEVGNKSFIGAEEKAYILSHYLIKRFPTSPEAQKLKRTIDITSQDTTEKLDNILTSYGQKKNEVTCGKCGTTTVYNKQNQKCAICGDWLYQHMVSTKEAPREEDKAVHHQDATAIHCPKCRSTQVTAQKQGFGLGKAAVGAVLTGGIGLLGGFIRSRKIYLTCLKCGHRFKPQ